MTQQRKVNKANEEHLVLLPHQISAGILSLLPPFFFSFHTTFHICIYITMGQKLRSENMAAVIPIIHKSITIIKSI